MLTSDYEGRDFNALNSTNNIVIVYSDFKIQIGNLVGYADTIGYMGDNFRMTETLQGRYLINIINRLKELRKGDQVNEANDVLRFSFQGHAVVEIIKIWV